MRQTETLLHFTVTEGAGLVFFENRNFNVARLSLKVWNEIKCPSVLFEGSFSFYFIPYEHVNNDVNCEK